VRRSSKFLVHDEKNDCRVGDWVRIQETRPLSRRKRWRVIEVISKAAQFSNVPESAA
jgi:small subunit ribosomal protein S17